VGGDVQKTGNILGAENPHIAVLYDAEHVMSLFCKDVVKLTPIHIVVLKYQFLYWVFGSRSMHYPYLQYLQSAPKN
jgi:hypothetical protein